MKLSYLSTVAAIALLSSPAFAADRRRKSPSRRRRSRSGTRSTITGYVEGSATPNFNNPYNGLNFGRLFDDRAGEPIFNAGSLTFSRLSTRKPPASTGATSFRG